MEIIQQSCAINSCGFSCATFYLSTLIFGCRKLEERRFHVSLCYKFCSSRNIFTSTCTWDDDMFKSFIMFLCRHIGRLTIAKTSLHSLGSFLFPKKRRSIAYPHHLCVLKSLVEFAHCESSGSNIISF